MRSVLPGRMRRALFNDEPTAVRAIKTILPLRLRNAVVMRMMCTDRASRRNLQRGFTHRLRGTAPVRLRALGGEAIWIRPETGDPWIVRETFTYRDSLPPPEVGEPDVVLDLGANIGTSMVLMAAEFPNARIIGLEPDPSNAELCRLNIRPWADRCELVEAAAWISDGEVSLAGHDSAELRIGERGRAVRALSLPTLLAGWAGDHVDFLKLDVEGAEGDLLGHPAGWDAVRCVSVEVHAPYTVDRCSTDLEALGFQVSYQPASRGPRVVGRKVA